MSLWNHYFVVDSVPALKTLEAGPGPARLIAGGTDLLLDLQQGRLSPMDTLVDVTRVPELTVLEMRDMRIYIGAAVPLNRIVASPLIQVHAQALVEACGQIGGPQVRNTGTLGGNVGHALPAADGTIALIAMGAEAEIAHIRGRRRVSLEETALLEGLEEVAEEIFDLPVRRGDPGGVGGLVDRVSTPDFATAVGLILYGFHIWQDRGLAKDRKKGAFARFKDWFRER